MGLATTAFVEWFVFVIMCLVCFISCIMAIALAVFYLGAERPVGASYVFRPLTVAVNIRDEEVQQGPLRSGFGDEIKGS